MTARPAYSSEDFHHSPFVAFYELTRACDFVCAHCRACAQPSRHPHELTVGQSRALIEQFTRFPKPPVLVFTGGDPLKRDDVYDLVTYARRLDLTVAMTPSATPLVTDEALRRLHAMGLHRLALSIDGSDAATHDDFRGVPGSFDRTLTILREARHIGLPLQINTTVTRRNVDQIDPMARMLAPLGIELWSVFFLVPVGRGLAEQRISPEQYELVFARLWRQARIQPYGIKTTEAHHYRRFVLQHAGDPQRGAPGRSPLGINDGRGVMFVSHTGQIFPSGFLPIECGRFPRDSIIDVYQHHPTFRLLRSPDKLKGKCGVCEYRHVCGGSRARAYALMRDPMAVEPDCVYEPEGWRRQTVPC
ncbi:MAG: radical SAM protein [Phycisphaeraceae bacterium]|nr:radical SAM protein [Phycisphaeraceae bacterium]